MRERILGVDVGSYSVKVAEIVRSVRTFASGAAGELVGFYEQPVLPPALPVSPASTAEGGVSGEALAIQRVFEEYNLSGDFIYTALPGQKTALRVIELPFGNFKKIDTTIEFEMENYLPLPLEEVVVDYQILFTEKTRSKVLVAYARKGELIKFLNLFAPGELDPRFVGCEPVEQGVLPSLGVVIPEEATLLIDLGHEKTNLCLFSARQLRVARSIMIGGRDLTRQIAAQLKIPEPEAERIKIEMGQVGAEGADPMTRQVSEALTDVLVGLLVQIKQTLLAFQEEVGGVIPAVLLTGGTSRLPGIDQYLSKGLRKNVSFLDPVDIAASRLADSQWCRPIAATAVALAARGATGIRSRDIQFRRGEFAYKGEMRDLKSLVRQVGIQAAIITFFVLGTFLASYASLKGKIRDQGLRLAAVAVEVLPELPKKSLTQPKNVLSILSGRVGEIEERKKKIEEEVSLSVLSVLQEVSATLPARDAVTLDIDELTIAAGRIRMSGRTNSFEAVDQIKSALAKSPRLQNVATENVRKGVGDQIKFEISLELNPGEEKIADGA